MDIILHVATTIHNMIMKYTKNDIFWCICGSFHWAVDSFITFKSISKHICSLSL